jgi:hypothetical protein
MPMSVGGVWRVLDPVAALVALSSCGPPGPYVRYVGGNFGRAPKPIGDMEILRASLPEGRFQDLGTVTVTCPSQAEQAFGHVEQVGGCSYEWAVWQACNRASTNGGDGIHSIETAVSSSGNVVNLRASVFVRLPPLVADPAPRREQPPGPAPQQQKPTVEERLRHLDKLKADGLITPDEHAKRREEILKEI